MIKKTLIIGLIALSFLSFYTVNVAAVEGEIGDELDDVLNAYSNEEVTDQPNVDIEKLNYSRNGQSVTITLTVKGTIENIGTLDELTEAEDEDLDVTLYGFILETEKNEYNVAYINEELIIADFFSSDEVSGNFNVDGSDLTISFNLIDEGDKLGNLSANTMKIAGLLSFYMDEASGICIDSSSGSSGDTSGSSDEESKGISSGMLFLILIIVVIVAGIIVVVYFIRRWLFQSIFFFYLLII